MKAKLERKLVEHLAEFMKAEGFRVSPLTLWRVKEDFNHRRKLC